MLNRFDTRRLPAKPPISPVLLVPHGDGPYEGAIRPGDVFAWEPDLPHARELLVVSCVERAAYMPEYASPAGEPLAPETPGGIFTEIVWCRRLDGGTFAGGRDQVGNPIDRFREAVVATMFKPQPPTRSIQQ